MATDPPASLTLTPLAGEPRPLADWVTQFHLVVVVLDPFTYESAWLIETAGRILTQYSAADCRVGWVVAGTADQAREFLGPWSERLLTFADPDRTLSTACAVDTLPALLHFNTAGRLEGAAEGWSPDAWRKVTDRLSRLMSWSRPLIPVAGDPAPYEGAPAAGS
ncbi:MAG: hypothetical protein ACRD0A_05325 [Acidimicrobiales bacterium]